MMCTRVEYQKVPGLRVDHDDGTQTWSQFKCTGVL